MKYMTGQKHTRGGGGRLLRYRKMMGSRLKLMRLYAYLCNRWWMILSGSCIPLKTILGENICFPHGYTGIFISEGAKIGNNCVIFQQVTIGSNTLPDSKKSGSPMIGNNVYIGAGAKIIGGIMVGDNVRIGANCVVTEDVPENCTVVLGKPRVIRKSNIQENLFVPYGVFCNREKGQKVIGS